MLHRTFPSLATLPSLSISLLGPPNSGKSSLLQSLFPHAPFMSAISPKTHTTRTTLTNKLLLSHSGKNSVINITDTPGLVYEAISGSDRRVLPKDITRMLNKIPVTHPHASKPVNICVLDAARLTMHQKKSHNRGNELPRWCNDVMAHAIATGSEYSYLLNKVDLVRDKRELLDLTLAIVELDRKLQINVMNDAGVEGEEVAQPTVFMVSCTDQSGSPRGVTGGGIPSVQRWLSRKARGSGLTEKVSDRTVSGGEAIVVATEEDWDMRDACEDVIEGNEFDDGLDEYDDSDESPVIVDGMSEKSVRALIELLEDDPDGVAELREDSEVDYQIFRRVGLEMGINLDRVERGEDGRVEVEVEVEVGGEGEEERTAKTMKLLEEMERDPAVLIELRCDEMEEYEERRLDCLKMGIDLDSLSGGDWGDDLDDTDDTEEGDMLAEFEEIAKEMEEGEGGEEEEEDLGGIFEDEAMYTPGGTMQNPTLLFTELLKQVCYEYLYKELPYKSLYSVTVDERTKVVDFVVEVQRESQRSVVDGAIRGKIAGKVAKGVGRFEGWEVGTIRSKVVRRNKA